MQSSGDRRRTAFLLGYTALCPLLAFRLSDTAFAGGTDLFFVPAIAVLILLSGRRLDIFSLQYLAFLTFASISIMFAILRNGFSFSDVVGLRLLSVALPYFIICRNDELEEASARRLLKVFLFSGAVAIIIGAAFYHLGIELRSTQQRLWVDGGVARLRAGGMVGDSGSYGHLVSVWGLVCCLSLIRSESRYKWLMMTAVLGLSGYGAFISSSRAALLHLLSGLILGTPLFLFNRNRFVVFCCLVCGGVLVIAGIVMLNPSLDASTSFTLARLDIFNLSGDSRFLKTERFERWQILISVALDNPVVGIGYKNTFKLYEIQNDNSFLGTFVEFGFLAAATYLTFWATLSIYFLCRALEGSEWGWIGLAVVLSEIGHSCSRDNHTDWYSGPLSMMFIGVFFRLAANDRRSKTIEDARSNASSAADFAECRQDGTADSRGFAWVRHVCNGTPGV